MAIPVTFADDGWVSKPARGAGTWVLPMLAALLFALALAATTASSASSTQVGDEFVISGP